jgi:hypothetical protein
MSRSRWIALVAVFASALFLGGFTSGATAAADGAGQTLGAVSRGPSGTIGHSQMEPPVVTAVDAARAPVLARSEGRQPLRLLVTALIAVAAACALVGQRGRSLGRVLELAIRAHGLFYGPAPGRRAPPSARAVLRVA